MQAACAKNYLQTNVDRVPINAVLVKSTLAATTKAIEFDPRTVYL